MNRQKQKELNRKPNPEAAARLAELRKLKEGQKR
jgi:hypothetical protein